MTQGEKVDELFKLKNEKKQLEAKVKDLNAEIEKIEYALIQQMSEAGLDQLKTGSGTVSRKIELYPKVNDKVQFLAFAYEECHPELLVLQANRAAYREYFETMGEYPPGTEGYMRETLSVRAKNSK